MTRTNARLADLSAGLTLLALAAVVTACGEAGAKTTDATKADSVAAAAPAPAGPPAVGVEVAVARLEAVANEVAATGRIEALQAIDVRPEVDGRIVQVLVREGLPVAAGAPLFRIDDAELRAQVAKATADRDLARQTLERTRLLMGENASAPADLERAEATARSAQAQLDLLSLRLARTVVRAPFAGVAGQRFVSIGDFVSPASRLVSLQTSNPQRVALSLPERHAGELRPGQVVHFTVAAFPQERFKATVEFVDPVVTLPARTITVKAIANNAAVHLQPGMFVEARVTTSNRSAAVVIPEEALMPSPGGSNAVWVVVDGKAVRRQVALGVRRAGVVEAASGVSAGEQVVVGGGMMLAEGAPVTATVVSRSTPPR